jgi:hypothetical protein
LLRRGGPPRPRRPARRHRPPDAHPKPVLPDLATASTAASPSKHRFGNRRNGAPAGPRDAPPLGTESSQLRLSPERADPRPSSSLERSTHRQHGSPRQNCFSTSRGRDVYSARRPPAAFRRRPLAGPAPRRLVHDSRTGWRLQARLAPQHASGQRGCIALSRMEAGRTDELRRFPMVCRSRVAGRMRHPPSFHAGVSSWPVLTAR